MVRQLPAESADFTGRLDALNVLDAVLVEIDRATPAAPVIASVEGPPGVGKTALAIHWAHRAAGRFPDGQLYVDLHGYTPGVAPMAPARALSRLVHALDPGLDRLPADLDELSALFRSLVAGRRLLMVLDNAVSAEQVRPLLPAGGCVVVVTSRSSLAGLVASPGARLVTLEPFDPAEATELLSRLLGRSLIRPEPSEIDDLARRCGYLPLALRIAAARLIAEPGRRAGDLVRDLSGRGAMTGLVLEAEPTLGVRVTFDASYETLSAGARRLFRRLALIPGPDFTHEAAGPLVGDSGRTLEALLAELVRGHLVESHEGRFRLHDLLRVYAGERCVAEDREVERAATRDRLFAWYLAQVDAAVDLVMPQFSRLPRPSSGLSRTCFADHDAAMGWLESEQANVGAAVQAAAAADEPWAWHLADALRAYFLLRPHAADWIAIASYGLRAAERAANGWGVAAMCLCLGQIEWRLCRFSSAATYLRDAATWASRVGWTRGEASAYGILGVLRQNQAKLDEARRCYSKALSLSRRNGERRGEAVYLTNLACAHYDKGNLRKASDYYGRALVVYRELGDTSGVAMNQGNLAMTQHARGLLDEGLASVSAALAWYRNVGLRSCESESLDTLAKILRDQGELPLAWEAVDEAVAIGIEARDPRVQATARNTRATICRIIGNHEQAVAEHEDALRLSRAIGYLWAEVEALIGVGAVLASQARPADARPHVEDALSIARRGGMRLLEGKALTVLAHVHTAAGAHPDAVAATRDALAIHKITGHRPGVRETNLLLAALSGAR